MNATHVFSMPNKAYHSSPGISFTGLTKLAKSPAHYQAYLQEEKEDTQAMKFGRAVHTLILEPEKFALEYAVCPEMDKRTKVGKELFAIFESENVGKTVISKEDLEDLKGISEAISANKAAMQTLSNGMAESSIFWCDDQTGVQCRIRPDYLRNDGIIVDLKTSMDASNDGFIGSISTYKYHLQTAFYLHGLAQLTGEKKTDFIHLVVEKKKPYGVKLFTLDDDSILQGMDEVRFLLQKYAFCQETDSWPGYSQTVENVRIPQYMFRSFS